MGISKSDKIRGWAVQARDFPDYPLFVGASSPERAKALAHRVWPGCRYLDLKALRMKWMDKALNVLTEEGEEITYMGLPEFIEAARGITKPEESMAKCTRIRGWAVQPPGFPEKRVYVGCASTGRARGLAAAHLPGHSVVALCGLRMKWLDPLLSDLEDDVVFPTIESVVERAQVITDRIFKERDRNAVRRSS